MVQGENWLSAAECAKRTGLTVRALRVYEREGLLRPLRSSSGWRRYSARDLARLNAIVSLKALGLSLAQIRAPLTEKSPSLPQVLRMQCESLKSKVAESEYALSMATVAARRLRTRHKLSLRELCELVRSLDAARRSITQSGALFVRGLMKELLTPEERHAWDTWWATHPKDAAQNAAFLRERTVRTLDWNDRVTTRFMSMEAEARAREPRSDRLPRPFASQKLLDFIDAARTASTGSVKLQQLLGDVEQLNNSGTQPGARAAQPLVRRLGELHTAFGGPVTATGWRIYAPHPYDTGIAVHGPGIPGFLLNSTAGPVGGGAAPLNIDLEREVAKVIDDPEQQLTDTERWTNLSTFAADGGKQLFYHGMSDPWFSAFDTIGYYGVQVA